LSIDSLFAYRVFRVGYSLVYEEIRGNDHGGSIAGFVARGRHVWHFCNVIVIEYSDKLIIHAVVQKYDLI